MRRWRVVCVSRRRARWCGAGVVRVCVVRCHRNCLLVGRVAHRMPPSECRQVHQKKGGIQGRGATLLCWGSGGLAPRCARACLVRVAKGNACIRTKRTDCPSRKQNRTRSGGKKGSGTYNSQNRRKCVPGRVVYWGAKGERAWVGVLQ